MAKLPGPIQAAADQLDVQLKEQAAQPEPENKPEPKSPEVTPQKKDKRSLEFWKHRYTTYKTETDKTIYDLRNLNNRLNDQVGALQAELAQLRANVKTLQEQGPKKIIPDGVLSAEDLDLLGEDNAERIIKLANASSKRQIESLENQVGKLEKMLATNDQERQQQAQHDANQLFWTQVRRVIPDVDEIDANPEFRKHLLEVDEVSGQTWMDLGRSAKQSGDVGRVIAIYRDWSNARKADGSREDDAVPSGRSSPVPKERESSGKIWSTKEYEDQVMRLTRTGVSSPENQKKLDNLYLEYLQALREGRVRG